MIPVTKPFLPPRVEYDKYLDGIWSRRWLTNHGPLVTELEQQIPKQLSTPPMLYLSNGTVALQIAIKALGLSGEIITTPFSYVATTSSILWEGCKPVFVDIDRETLNIDPKQIEAKITKETTAILATHVFGVPCDVEAIELIAQKHNLKIIYDAAHCFGSKLNNKSLFQFGDVSTTSFHATKLYHTIEGGAVFANNEELLIKMSKLRNFGHEGPEHFVEIGINGKNSEYHAAMGLVNLGFVESIIQKRKALSELYDYELNTRRIKFQLKQTGLKYNYAYYPAIFESEEKLIEVVSALNKKDIYPRRYFFPSLNTIRVWGGDYCPNSESVASRILCLPLFDDLAYDDVKKICAIINQTTTK